MRPVTPRVTATSVICRKNRRTQILLPSYSPKVRPKPAHQSPNSKNLCPKIDLNQKLRKRGLVKVDTRDSKRCFLYRGVEQGKSSRQVFVTFVDCPALDPDLCEFAIFYELSFIHSILLPFFMDCSKGGVRGGTIIRVVAKYDQRRIL